MSEEEQRIKDVNNRRWYEIGAKEERERIEKRLKALLPDIKTLTRPDK